MTDEQIKEIMALADAYAASKEGFGVGFVSDEELTFNRDAVESALRAAVPDEKYVPVDSKLRDGNWNHPNDTENRTDACRNALNARGDDEGQGLDGFWKWGFAAGFNAALEASPQAPQAAQPVQPVQPSECEWTNCPRRVGDACCNDCPGLAAQQAGAVRKPLSDAASDVLAERQRQISVEGWTPEHDDEHERGDLVKAAACYALHSAPIGSVRNHLCFWPWDERWWKPKDSRSNLIKAGALILAEIERLDRAHNIREN